MVFSKKWLKNDPQFLLYFLIHNNGFFNNKKNFDQKAA